MINEQNICENYRDDDVLRNKFYEFIGKVFPSADFRKWYSMGFWANEFIPHSIVVDDKIVSNVTITRMKILVDGNYRKGIQFGAVGTIPEYRMRGLSRLLMEYTMDKYRDSTDFFFLFANDTVVDFYPKFGFEKHSEVIFKSTSNIPRANYSARKLDINSEADMAIVLRLLKNRIVLSELFGASDYSFVSLWHILNLHPQNLHYLEDEDILFIVSEKKGALNVWDIVHTRPFEISSTIPKVISSDNLESISYYFSPDKINFDYDMVETRDDSPLFVLGDFPVKDRNFKFPSTAET